MGDLFMANFAFPTSPSAGSTYTAPNGAAYKYVNGAWQLQGGSSSSSTISPTTGVYPVGTTIACSTDDALVPGTRVYPTIYTAGAQGRMYIYLTAAAVPATGYLALTGTWEIVTSNPDSAGDGGGVTTIIRTA